MARRDTASRLIAAPPERVYAALVDPEALASWLPPDGMSGQIERFDLRPGGSYRLVLTFADASASQGKTSADSDVVEARFVDVVPGVRVVQAVDFVSDDPAFAGTMTMSWEVTATDGGTRLDITADDVPDGITAEDHSAGLASSLRNLADYLETAPLPRRDESAGRPTSRKNEHHDLRLPRGNLMAFRPYLFFGGNCREAFTRYQEIFGGDLMVMAMKDVPGEDPPPDQADMVIHAALTIGDDLLMASDDPTSKDFSVQGMMVSYDASDVDDAKRVFEGLAEGGTVTQKLEPTFFSPAFGMCRDRFGTPWMVVTAEEQPPG